MRTFLFLLGVLTAQALSAQVITGLYRGSLTNDSTKKDQRYELALSEYRGKITGYSYTTFVRNDSLFYGVKRVKATRKENQLVVEDDGMIANNFPEAPARKVHQTNFIQLTGDDTLRNANGSWQTNRTKIYYAIGGGVSLKMDNDSTHSALIGHLKELGVISQPKYTYAAVRLPTEKRKEKQTEVQEEVYEKPRTEAVRSVAQSTKTKIPVANPGLPVAGRMAPPVLVPYIKRAKSTIQEIDTESDSLMLSFYDNGVIDGDSVSVYVNGENVISNARLTATATRKLVKLPSVETVEIILVAENLGTLPPNTGLLVIKDGDRNYQVHFSADLQTNAAIIFKRKMK